MGAASSHNKHTENRQTGRFFNSSRAAAGNLRNGATAGGAGGATADAKPPDWQVVVRILVEI
jgi:hypothetical protein